MAKIRYAYDIETNGLFDTVDTIWCLVIVDADTNEVFKYSDYDESLQPLSQGPLKLDDADILFGHNVIGYDNVVLKKLTGWEPKAHQTVTDTWLLSLINRYKRDHKHGLAGWGQHLGFPKGDFTDFSQYTPEMLTYCIRDVELNVKVYHTLVGEAKKILAKHPMYAKGIEVEMKFAMIESEIQHKGWMFNMPAAVALLQDPLHTLDA